MIKMYAKRRILINSVNVFNDFKCFTMLSKRITIERVVRLPQRCAFYSDACFNSDMNEHILLCPIEVPLMLT